MTVILPLPLQYQIVAEGDSEPETAWMKLQSAVVSMFSYAAVVELPLEWKPD